MQGNDRLGTQSDGEIGLRLQGMADGLELTLPEGMALLD